MKMVGYWDDRSPLTCDNDLVKATLYSGKNRSIIAVAGWGDKELACGLKLDWKALGYESSRCKLTIPAIAGFQEAQTLSSLDHITIPPGKGYLIVIDNVEAK
jgi:hypothetical protein